MAGFELCCVFVDQVALVFPNNDPGMFCVAFYGCLLAEVIPVPIEVPLSRKVGETSGSMPGQPPSPCSDV